MSGQRGVALEALRRYDVAPRKVTLAAESFNSIFRVATASAVYALRVGSAVQIHPEGTSAVEVAWHRRLRQQGLCVPAVLANVGGEFVTRVSDDRAEHGFRACVLTLFADALARAQSAVDSLWRSPPHPPRLLHGDLTPANVIVSPPSGLVPIDFQDTVRGFEVQDLSITVAALRRWPDGGRLVDAFRSGYGECRAWPEVSPALFESLIIARGLHQMNLTLNMTDIGRLERYVAGHAERVRPWGHANRGKLKRWSTGGSVTCTRPGMIACRQRPLRACRKGLRR